MEKFLKQKMKSEILLEEYKFVNNSHFTLQFELLGVIVQNLFFAVPCCSSIVLATSNADFLATSYYTAYIAGTYVTNGTTINTR
jgi:hypothetical protein